MARQSVTREWIKGALETRGHRQRDLAKLWGTSEAAVSRFLGGLDSGDLPLGKAYTLTRMLGMDLEEFAKRMGYAGGTIALPAPIASAAVPVPTFSVQPHDGKIRLLAHLDLAPEAAGDLMKLLAAQTTAQATTPDKK